MPWKMLKILDELDIQGAPRRTLASALWTITLADVSMSIDNVLAVAAIADGNTQTWYLAGLGDHYLWPLRQR